MTDKMREAFEKWATGEGLCTAPYGASYLDEKTHTAWITWQAKQSVPSRLLTEDERFDLLGEIAESGGAGRLPRKSVPVVGEVVAGAIVSEEGEWPQFTGTPNLFNLPVGDYSLIIRPTTSITEADLERLRKDTWQCIKTAPSDGTEIDLYGYIAYDSTEMRLANCTFEDGEWKYFSCGEMRPITDIAFTPEYWRPIIPPVIDLAKELGVKW